MKQPMLHRALALLLALALAAVCLAGCAQQGGFGKDENARFTAFLDTLPPLLVDDTDSALNQLFADKQAAGFGEALYEWGTYSLDDFLEFQETWDAQYETLTGFDRSQLSQQNKDTYDILEASLREGVNEPSDEAYFYLANNPLGQYEGVLSDIPITLYFFNINTQEDLDSYLHLMETLPDYAAEILRFEQERQDNGYGMTARELAAVREMCEENIEGDVQFLQDTLEEKLAAADFLTDAAREEAAARGETLLDAGYRQFFRDLRDGIDGITVRQREDAALNNLPEGDTYYAALIESYTGFTDLDEYEDYLLTLTEETVTEVQALMMQRPELFDEYYDDELTLYDSTDPEEILAYLHDAMQADFPATREVNYSMKVLPEAMQALLPGTAAFYMIGMLDKPDAPQSMMLCSEYTQEDFTTIAHEGFPGHMYQHIYFNEVEHPLILDLLGQTGYTEGYANYIERVAVNYADDPDAARFAQLMDRYTILLILQFDYLMACEDVSVEEVRQLLCAQFGYDDPDSEDTWALLGDIIYRPGAFLPYYIAGGRFAGLRAEAEETLGDAFDLKAFHESLLRHGPAPVGLTLDFIRRDLGLALPDAPDTSINTQRPAA